MYQWLVFAHILDVFVFLLAHGTVAAVAFALTRQREVERVRALLDLSRGVTMVARVSLLVLLAAGITAGFMGNWWDRGWIWASLGLFILISVTMTILGSRPFTRLRQLVHAGNPSHAETISHSPLDPSEEKQLAVLLAATHPWLLTANRDWRWQLRLDPLADAVQAVLTDKGSSAFQLYRCFSSSRGKRSMEFTAKKTHFPLRIDEMLAGRVIRLL